MTALQVVSCFLLGVLVLGSFGFAAAVAPCDDPSVANLPFCNYKLDLLTRVEDLVGRLTTAEKISQLGNTAPGIDRLKIPSYQWWSEALHGVAYSPGVSFGGEVPAATSFPQVIGLGATFNMTLVRLMAVAISTEARAMYNVGRAGLTFFAPNINIYRDPRWGRGQETPGEDPYLTSQYVVQFVQGMQEGNDVRYLKTAVCCKHFAAYDLENWNGTDRHHFNAIVADQDLIETYFPAFETCVRVGRVASVMCSYNEVNGVPSCANDLIQNKVTRDQWGFEGFIVSDCGAISDIENTHHYTNTTADTVRDALRGGTDLNCGGFYQKYAQDAYNKGEISDKDLDTAVGRLFAFRIFLGMFDPHNIQPYWNITPAHVNSPYHQELALEAARQSMVLLQNDGTLPLSTNLKVALIGPNSNATKTMQGNYNGAAPYLVSPLEGIQKLRVSVTTAMGCDVKCQDDSGFAAAVNAAKGAEAVIVVVGLDQSQESEGHDRTELTLPGKQLQLLQAVRNATAEKTPFIVVLMSGGPVDIGWAKTNANGIMWVGYPGQSGGQALAEVLFGRVNPSGRLPYTMYPADYVNQISFFNMSMRAPPGQSYKFYTGTPVFTFGDGLSYTSFSFQWSEEGVGEEPLVLSRSQLQQLESVDYRVTVTNTGKLTGSVSVLAFVKPGVPGAPLKQLFGFQKVRLTPGQSMELFFATSADTFTLIHQEGQKELVAGDYWVEIGELQHLVQIIA